MHIIWFHWRLVLCMCTVTTFLCSGKNFASEFVSVNLNITCAFKIFNPSASILLCHHYAVEKNLPSSAEGNLSCDLLKESINIITDKSLNEENQICVLYHYMLSRGTFSNRGCDC